MSTSVPLPRSVISFVRVHVDHVVKLQFLLGVHSAPNGTTSISAIARILDVPKAQVRDMANELAGEGVLRVSAERVELTPRTIDERLALADLADAYARNREAVLDLLKMLRRAD